LELYSFVKEQKNQNQFGAKRSFNLSVDHFLRVLHHELANKIAQEAQKELMKMIFHPGGL
jgi:hypothetical protein